MDVADRSVDEAVAPVSRRLLPVVVARAAGASLLVASRRDAPLVTVALEFNGGHADDPRDRPGLADLAASLCNEGGGGMPPLEWHRRLDNDAISMEIQPTVVRWVARLSCLVEDLDEAVDLFARWLEAPTLPADEWKRLVKTYRAGAREQWAQPIGVVDALSSVQVFGFGHPMAHPAHEKSYAQSRYEEACDVARGAPCRESDIIAMVGGDIDQDTGLELLRRLIDRLPAGTAVRPREPEPAGARHDIWILDNREIDQVYFALGRVGSRAGDPQRMALRLADYALGSGGFSSRLMKRVRSEMGHTYSIGSALTMDQVLGPFQIQSFTQTTNLAAMLELIFSELEAIANDGFTADEVDDARRHLHGSLPLHLTSPEVILRVTADGLHAGLGLEDLEADWNSIPDITRDDVNAAARRLLGDFRLALIGPADQLRSQVADRGSIAEFPFGSAPDCWAT